MAKNSVKSKHRLIANLEAELLKRVRAKGSVSRVQLSRELHLAPSTAGIYVDRLVREGFLAESKKVLREAGRPPKLIELNPDGGRFIGVDFEAASLMATAVDFSQRPLRQLQQSIVPGDSVEKILERIETAIAEVMRGDRRPVLGIGVGVPGLIDPRRGVAVEYGFIPGWRDVPLAARLSEKFGVPVHLENNIRSMALAELWFGAGRGLKNFICLGVRTGIAAGLVVNGHLLQGGNSRAGEIGKWPWLDSPVSGRQPASLEQLCALPAILVAASEGRRKRLDFDAFTHAVSQRDELCLTVLERTAALLGRALAQLHQLLDPERIIIAGPMTQLGETFRRALGEALHRDCTAAPPSEIVLSGLGPFSGAIGAAALALHQWRPAR